MREFIKKIITFKNLMGLLTIILYFLYVGINIYLGNGNKPINIILLALTSVYLVTYIHSVYIEYNKKIKKGAKKIFVRVKKFLGFSNACVIIASVFSNNTNTFWNIFVAVITIVGFLLYAFIDIASTLALREIKKYKKDPIWGSSYKNN